MTHEPSCEGSSWRSLSASIQSLLTRDNINQPAISSGDRIVLREKLASLHIVLGVFVQQLANRERDLSNRDVEKLLTAVYGALKVLTRP